MRRSGEKITMLTCYDASFAALMNDCDVEILLVGDSLGMVCQGQASTVPVRLDAMLYHTTSVAKGNRNAMVMADLPFGTYGTPTAAYDSAAALLRAGAHMVKLEGDRWAVETVRFLSQRGIPVCAHIGLTPQSVHQLGGYRVQGRTVEAAASLTAAALAHEAAGAALVLLEAIPADVGRAVTAALQIPTIGIGAGPDCSGQVLVVYDALGIFPGKPARFVKNFMVGSVSIGAAISAFVADVKAGKFPAAVHCF